jgi:hypothetical protein
MKEEDMQFIATRVPNDQIEAFCNVQTGNGATKCDATDNGDGTSEVLVEYPDE